MMLMGMLPLQHPAPAAAQRSRVMQTAHIDEFASHFWMILLQGRKADARMIHMIHGRQTEMPASLHDARCC